MDLRTASWPTSSDGLAPAAAHEGPPLVAPAAQHDEGRSWLGRFASRRREGRGRVRQSDLLAFIRHLATLLNAGLPLSKGLATLAKQFENPRTVALVTALRRHLDSGEMLSSAMALHPRAFGLLVVNVVRAGEVGGTLPETLTQLADDLEKRDQLRKVVVGAMVYPVVVLIVAALVVGFVLTYVVPTFEGIYRKMNLDLPFITQMLLFASRVLLRWWWALALGLAAAVLTWRQLSRRESVRIWRDGLVLRLPLVGALARKSLAARFLGAFATLIGSGVTIVESLRLMGGLMGNAVAHAAIEDVRRHVSRGARLSAPMERYADLFSPVGVQMVSVGEETGSLPEAAARAARFLAEEVEQRVKMLTTLLEPMLTVGLGFVVGTIALAVYLPMFDLMKHVSR